MRVVVTGSGGQVGRELIEAFTGHDVVAHDHAGLDVGERESVLQAVAAAAPDAIVHAAAWTDVDGCETEPERAWRVNAMGTRHVAEAARLVGARVCYLSSDYVFDGRAGRAYTEWDEPGPVSVYGRSKLAGERELSPSDTVVRTSWVCGRHGHNFVRTILGRAADGRPLRVVDDQHGCFTSAADLAGAVRDLVTSRRPGVFHVTNQGATTWYRLAREAVEAAGMDPLLVTPIGTREMDPPRPAPRPAYSVLENTALRLSGLPLLPHHRDSLRALVAQMVVAPAASPGA